MPAANKRKSRQPCTIKDLKAAAYNPRRISKEALGALSASLTEVGDISGIVWNSRSRRLVCGHQRLQALRRHYGRKLKLDKQTILAPDGRRFPIRIVDWPKAKERAANIAAEQLGRKCYAIEIEPRYVDVAVERWENFTGKKARREEKGK